MSRRGILYAFVFASFVTVMYVNKLTRTYDNQNVAPGVVPYGFTRSDVTLKPDEAERVIARPNQLAVVTHEGTKTAYVPEEAKTVVSVSTHGVVSVTVQRMGLCFAPGVGIAYASRWSVVLDARLGFYNRWSFLLGCSFRLPTPYVAVGYNSFRRTSVFVGYGRNMVLGGLRVSF